MKISKRGFSLITGLTLLGLVAGSFWLGTAYARTGGRPSLPFEAALLQDNRAESNPTAMYVLMQKVIRDTYVGDSIVDPTRLTYAAVRGMMGALGDPFTRFLSPEEWKKANEENSGTYSGIGAQLDRRKTKEGFILVSKPIPNSPAWKAGIKGGDLIVAVNGESVEKMDIDEAIRRIKGETGTKVRVTIRRDGQDRVYELTRAAVDYPIIETAMLPGKIGYIQLTSFNRLADQKLDAGLTELEQHPDGPMKGLILDLRFNPGGLLDQAVDVGSRFVPDGPVMWRKLRQGEMRPEMANPKKRNHARKPLVILINGGSASASEIVAGAVKDAGTGVLVGERTYGKGLVQSLAPLRYGGQELAVAITTEHYYTRNKVDIDRQGVVPDVEVKTTDEDLKDLKNPSAPQLKKALEEVGKLISKQDQ